MYGAQIQVAYVIAKHENDTGRDRGAVTSVPGEFFVYRYELGTACELPSVIKEWAGHRL